MIAWTLWAFFFALFSYLMVQARTRRQVVAVTLIGILAVTLVAPPQAEAQGLWSAITVVLNVINGVIKTGLNAINSVRTAISNLYQQVTWPLSLIKQARALVTQMVGQYRSLMRNMFRINLHSATLPNPAALESLMRNHQTGDFASLVASYGTTYGGVVPASLASPEDRAMMDMDDALALDIMKTTKATDSADDLTLQAADAIEDEASQAAPGSAPFLTASAVVATIQSQALTQKMLAAQLRQEAARIAHENAYRKRGATLTGNVNTQILNLLQRH